MRKGRRMKIKRREKKLMYPKNKFAQRNKLITKLNRITRPNTEQINKYKYKERASESGQRDEKERKYS